MISYHMIVYWIIFYNIVSYILRYHMVFYHMIQYYILWHNCLCNMIFFIFNIYCIIRYCNKIQFIWYSIVWYHMINKRPMGKIDPELKFPKCSTDVLMLSQFCNYKISQLFHILRFAILKMIWTTVYININLRKSLNPLCGPIVFQDHSLNNWESTSDSMRAY